MEDILDAQWKETKVKKDSDLGSRKFFDQLLMDSFLIIYFRRERKHSDFSIELLISSETINFLSNYII